MAKKISLEYQQLTDCAKELNKLKNMQIEALTRIRRMSSIYFNSEQRAMSRNIKEFESYISYSISINNKSVSSTVDLVNYLNKAVRDFSAAEQELNQMINAGSKIKDIENNLGALLNVWGKELTSINKNELKSLPNTAEKLKENIMNDFSAIWKSFDKNDEELNKVITAANTIIKAAWNYNKEEHPIEAGIESSLANFATSTIKGIGGLLNGVGEQWYNLREDPKGTLKNWWNFTVDVVSFLSPNLPKTEDDLNFEYNLANSIIKDGDTRLVHGDAYSRTQYIADWVLNIGSLFLGGEAIDSMKGFGQTGEVVADTSKIEKISEIGETSKAKVMTKVSVDTTKMSDLERTNYILDNTDLTREQVQDYLDINYYRNPDIGDTFRNEGIIKSGNDVLIPRSTRYLDEDGFINWELAPEKGYVLDDEGNPIKEILTSNLGEKNRIFDRFGNQYGNYLSPVDAEGNSYDFEERALPFVEDLSTRHIYEETGDLSNIRNDIINSNLSDLRKQELLNKLGDNKTFIGEAKGAFDQIGGAKQIETPLSIKELCEIGTLTER